MRVLVCGSRDWDDWKAIYAVLEGVYTMMGRRDLMIIEGCARGADTIAGEWAEASGVQHLQFPAQWATEGKAAGPIRNQRMLDDGDPELVLAFHDNLAESKGTGDMVRRAKARGVDTFIIGRA